MTQFKNIIFDLGGVILPIDYSKIIEGFTAMGGPAASELYQQAKQDPLFDALETGKLSGPEFLNRLQSHFPNHSHAEILNVWNSMLGQMPANRPALLAKVAKQFRIFLLSNTNALHQAAFEKQCKESLDQNLTDWFENTYYSHIEGFRKPDIAIFQLVLLENNLNPHQTLFIEDSFHNVQGALQAQIPTLYLKPELKIDLATLFNSEGRLMEAIAEPLILYP